MDENPNYCPATTQGGNTTITNGDEGKGHFETVTIATRTEGTQDSEVHR